LYQQVHQLVHQQGYLVMVSKRYLLLAVVLASLGFFWLAYRSLDGFVLDNTATKATNRRSEKTAVNQASAESFRYPLNSTILKLRSHDLPPPFQVMEDYLQWHSVDALERDSNLDGRKFAIAFYQCPREAGNQMHRFWNQVLWAVLVNRTVLWKYWSNETCLKYSGKELHRQQKCQAANTVDDCGKVLVRAPWIPSFDEWKDRLMISANESFAFYSSVGRPWHDDVGFPLSSKDEKMYCQIAEYSEKVVALPICVFKIAELLDSRFRESVLKTQEARERAVRLYDYGVDFLYGMLHHYTFDDAKTIRDSIPNQLEQYNNPTYYTIGLHSRHFVNGVDGCNIEREIACLQTILSNRKEKNSPVHVNIMTDRACTVTNLTLWLHEHNCSVLTVKHEVTPGDIQEHGPYAGAGFYRDLALVSRSRSALIGMDRTSTDMLREMMEYDKMMEAWQGGGDPRGPEIPLDICLLVKQVKL
jgi:hypothetical protein